MSYESLMITLDAAKKTIESVTHNNEPLEIFEIDKIGPYKAISLGLFHKKQAMNLPAGPSNHTLAVDIAEDDDEVSISRGTFVSASAPLLQPYAPQLIRQFLDNGFLPYGKLSHRREFDALIELTYDLTFHQRNNNVRNVFVGVGVFFYLITAIMMSMFYTLGVSNASDGSAWNAYAISAGVASFIITMTLFCYSGALENITKTGDALGRFVFNIGNDLAKIDSEASQEIQSTDCGLLSKRISAISAFLFIVLVGVTAGSITMYESVSLLGEQDNPIVPKSIVPILAWALSIFNFVDGMVVYGSFSKRAAEELVKYGPLDCFSKRMHEGMRDLSLSLSM